jgi:glycosyltransferase involved in cell wall biosynthesis
MNEPRPTTIPPEQVTLAIEGWNASDLQNREAFQRSLGSLAGQTYPVDKCQLLIVLDASVPEQEAAWILDHLPNARFLRVPAATYFRSKNRALEAAKTEFLVFADSDVEYSGQWLENLLACFSDGHDLVGGNTQYEHGPLGRTLSLCDWAATRLTSGYSEWFYGNNLAMRSSLLKRLRFREDLGISGGGAVNVLREQLRATGVMAWFCVEARGLHHLAPFLQKRLRVGGYQIHFRRSASETSWSWLARAPLLAPFLVTAGTAIRSYQRAWRLRSTLPGKGASLPFYLLTITAVKAVEWIGSALVAWMPGYVSRRYGWFDVPHDPNQASQPA